MPTLEKLKKEIRDLSKHWSVSSFEKGKPLVYACHVLWQVSSARDRCHRIKRSLTGFSV